MKRSKLVLAATIALAQFAEAQSLVDAPRPQRTVDKPFVFTTATDVGLMTADFALSVNRISHSHNPCVYEVNPMFGARKPSAGQYAKVMIPITIATAFAGYELKKHDVKVWALPQAVHSILSFTGIVSNAPSKENWPCH